MIADKGASDYVLETNEKYLGTLNYCTTIWECSYDNTKYKIQDVTQRLEIPSVGDAEKSDAKFHGAFGVVRKGLFKDGTAVAIKTLFTSADKQRDPKFWDQNMIDRKVIPAPVDLQLHLMLFI